MEHLFDALAATCDTNVCSRASWLLNVKQHKPCWLLVCVLFVLCSGDYRKTNDTNIMDGHVSWAASGFPYKHLMFGSSRSNMVHGYIQRPSSARLLFISLSLPLCLCPVDSSAWAVPVTHSFPSFLFCSLVQIFYSATSRSPPVVVSCLHHHSLTRL